MKVVGINSSPRKGGNTTAMIRVVFSELEKAGIETSLIEMGNKPLRGCAACYKCKENQDGRCIFNDDAMNEYIKAMLDADGIILGSPVYFADANTNMHALIERCGVVARGNGNLLKRKVGAAVVPARRAGFLPAFDSINHFLHIQEMIVPGSVYWNLGIAKQPGDFEKDLEGIKTMKVLGQNMAWLLKKINA